MRKVEFYVCDICGSQYSSKAECEFCEKDHKSPVKIVLSKYVKTPENRSGYPVSVTVLFDNGATVIYKR